MRRRFFPIAALLAVLATQAFCAQQAARPKSAAPASAPGRSEKSARPAEKTAVKGAAKPREKAAPGRTDGDLAAGDLAWSRKSYALALRSYRAALKAKAVPRARRPEVELRVVRCLARTKQWDAAFTECAAFVQRRSGSVWEARGEAARMELFYTCPPNAWRVGDRLYRTEKLDLPETPVAAQPERVSTLEEDSRKALTAGERALSLYGSLPPDASTAGETADVAADMARLVTARFLPVWAAKPEWPAPDDPLWKIDPAADYQSGWPAPRKALQLYALAEREGTARQKSLARLEAAVWLRGYQAEMRRIAWKQEPDGTWAAVPFPYQKENATEQALRLAKDLPESPEADHARMLAAAWLAEDGRCTEALGLYRELLKNRPQSPWAKTAEAGAAELTRLQLSVSAPQSQEPGKKARLQLNARNLKKLKLTAHRVKLEELFREAAFHPANTANDFDPLAGKAGLKALRKFFHGDPVQWEVDVAALKAPAPEGETEQPRDPRAPLSTELETPLTKNGAYVVEADGGPVRSAALLVVTDLAVTELAEAGRATALVVNAGTGAPVFDAAVLMRETLPVKDGETHRLAKPVKSGPEGLAERDLEAGKVTRLSTLAWKGDRYAWTGMANVPAQQDAGERRTAYVYTERPVYRPAQTVHFRALLAAKTEEGWKPRAEETVRVQVTDPQGAEVRSLELTSNEFGSIHGSLELSAGAPLGQYSLAISHGKGKERVDDGDGGFRVEEYKKPEFEVTAAPATQAGRRLRAGQPVRVRIAARYYWGAPVPKAKVKVTARAENWRPASPFSEGRRYFETDELRRPDFERVFERERADTIDLPAVTDAQGEAYVTLPASFTRPRQKGEGVRLSLSAEVTDASRRTIQAAAQLELPAAEYSAFVHPRRGFFAPAEAMQADLRTLDAEGKPVPAEGELVVLRRVYRNEQPAWVEAHREAIRTGGDGAALFQWVSDRGGAYQLRFEGRDAQEAKVEASAELWVSGEAAAEALPQDTDALLVQERETYAPGDGARLLLITREAGVTALLAQESGASITEKRLLKTPARSNVLTVPITPRSQPDVVVAIYGVFHRRGFTDAVTLSVPETGGGLDLQVSADKAVYKPGETATFHLRARDGQGRAVRTECSLGVVDASTFYIEAESTPSIKDFFTTPGRGAEVSVNEDTQQAFTSHDEDDQPVLKIEARDIYAFPRGLGVFPNAATGFNFGRVDLGGMFQGRAISTTRLPARANPFAPNAELRLMTGMAAGGVYDAIRARPEGLAAAKTPAAVALPAGAADLNGRPPAVRSNFADTAYWTPAVVTGPSGEATVTFTWPDNLTQWRASSRGWTERAQVGEGSADVTTAKDLLVRLQAPRFFVERDEVTLSANVHNYTAEDRRVRVTLQMEGDALYPATGDSFGPARPKRVVVPRLDRPEQPGPVFDDAAAGPAGDLFQWVDVPKGQERRVDWRLRVERPGEAKVRVLADAGSVNDAMELRFPVEVHGVEKFVVKGGTLPAGGEKGEARSTKLTLDLPAERDPHSGDLTVQVSPTVAGTMLDALPYLVDYPYGCVEQTLSRFVPAVVSARTLTELGVSLDDLRKHSRAEWARVKALPADRPADSAYSYPSGAPGMAGVAQRERETWRWRAERSPVYNPELLKKITAEGLARLARFQHKDGGWGWWERDSSDTEMTAYVVRGLLTGRAAGLAVPAGMVDRGLLFLEKRFAQLKNPHSLASCGYVLSLDRKRAPGVAAALLAKVYPEREKLSAYGVALLALALKSGGKADEARVCVQNLENGARVDKEAGTCFWPGNVGRWWSWYNDDAETAAACLRAYDAVDPKNRLAPMVVRWLVNNRQGASWSTTRETAMAVEALAEYVKLHRELQPEMTVTVDVDGKWKRRVTLKGADALLADGRVTVPAQALAAGARTVTLTRQGTGSLYYTAALRYFTLEEGIRSTGGEIRVRRRYFRLVRPEDPKAKGLTPDGYERKAVQPGERLSSGDLLEVELLLESKSGCEYVVFEDMKPAGCEPVELRSGGSMDNGWCSNVELRDQKVAFFFTQLPAGKQAIRYRLRAEIPGSFHALPVNGYAMYAPGVRCISDEDRIGIEDGEQQQAAEGAAKP